MKFGLPARCAAFGVRSLLCVWLVFAVVSISSASPSPAPIVVQFPSRLPSGNAVNDQIWVTFYPAANTLPGQRAPAVVLTHPLRAAGFLDRFVQRIARQFAARGVGCAYLTLPYHKQRRPPGDDPLRHFAGSRVEDDVAALQQSASDVSTTVAWLKRQPGVDPERVGVVGGSLGGIVLHLAMGQDPEIKVGVVVTGGGDLARLYRTSLMIRLFGKSSGGALDAGALEKLQAVEPAVYAGNNRPRRVLMVAAARDVYITPHSATFLWSALGRPPIRWIDTNHFIGLSKPEAIADFALVYLRRVWSGHADDPAPLPRLDWPTLKIGLISGLDARVTPAFQWQFQSFGSRPDHMALFHADLGLSGRGPFVSVAATLNAYMDVGAAYRLGASRIRPYFSVHFVL